MCSCWTASRPRTRIQLSRSCPSRVAAISSPRRRTNTSRITTPWFCHSPQLRGPPKFCLFLSFEINCEDVGRHCRHRRGERERERDELQANSRRTSGHKAYVISRKDRMEFSHVTKKIRKISKTIYFLVFFLLLLLLPVQAITPFYIPAAPSYPCPCPCYYS